MLQLLTAFNARSEPSYDTPVALWFHPRELMPGRVFTWIIHYVVVELKNDHQTDECLTKKSSRTTNHRLKLTMCKVQPANFTVLLDPFSKHITVLCSPNFSTMKSLNPFNRDLPKVTLCMNSGWFDSSEASHKKAHWLVEGEMSSHLFFYKSIWSFLWLTSAVSDQPEFM